MADDLSQFFVKKTQKSKEKKKGVIKLDAVGQQLERKVKRQEERDREDEEDERLHQAEEHFLKSRKDPEDSEWLDYNDPNKEIKLAEFGIKDMNLTEQVELFDEEEERATPSEPTKTWNVPTAQDENQAPVDLPPPPTDGQPQKYVPAHMRTQRNRPSATPDINNQEMFPSLAAAEQIEKHQRDSEKREEQRKMEFNEKQSKIADDRQAALNAVKREVNPNAYQVPGRRPDQPSEPLSQSPPPPASQKSTYVPPHLRNRGGEGPSEPPPAPVRSGGAWGSRDQSGTAPPPPSTNNRFASLKE